MSSSHFLALSKLIGFIFLLTSTLNACLASESSIVNSSKSSVNQLETNRSQRAGSIDESKLNERINVEGTAENAMLGAVVMTEDLTPVFLDGIKEWDSQIVGKSVVVTGVLRRKLLAPKTTIYPNGEISQGVEGESYVLENPSWFVER